MNDFTSSLCGYNQEPTSKGFLGCVAQLHCKIYSPHFQCGSECKKQIALCDLKFQVAPNDKRTDGYSVLINKCIKVVLINKLLSRFGQIRAVKLG